MEALLRDAYYAMRRLAKAPAFSVTAIVVLAIGIGATTSIFTLAYALLWKPLPVRAPEALYRLGNEPHCCYLGGYSQDGEFSLVSYELYEHLRDHTAGFSELAAFQAFPNAAFGVRSPGSDQAATALPGALVSGNYFAMLGVTASAGRLLTAEDDRAGAAPVVVLGYSRWQREYGADPAIVGKVIDINGQPFTVAGVAPAGFFGTSLSVRPPELFLPLHAEPLLMADAEIGHPATHWLDVMGRLAPGAEPAAIEAAMRLELTQWLRSHSSDMNDRDRALLDRQTLYLSPGGTGIPLMRAQYQRWLAMLGLISAFVLLIVCANLANLLLVRGMKRRPQTAVSVALGASTWALVRQALTESLLLALLGGAASLGVAALATRLILSFAFPSSEGLSAPAIEWPSAPVLPFALAVSTFVGVAFGLAPALIAARTQPLAALRGRGPSERGSSLPRRALVVCQAALSLVLLCATGLLTAAIHELEHQDFGFDRDGRTVVRIEPRLAGYEPARLPALYARVRETTSSIPGVAAVAVALHSPQSGDRWGARVFVDGAPPPAPGAANLALWNRATAGYFDVIGSRIIRGRGITTEDTATSRRVAVVNEAFAKAYLADRDPIGSRFGLEPQASRELEIVGVVEDARYDAQDPAGPIRPFFVVAEAQAPYTQNLGSLFLHDIVVRTSPGVSVSTEQLRGAIAAADPTVPVLWIRTLDRQVASQLNGQRLVARLATVFGAIAVLLSCVGLYGLTAYDVASRNAEIAMRMALGAHPTRVLQLVLQDAMTLVAWALVVGLPLAFAVGVSLGSELYGVSPFDPLVATLAVLALALTTFVAALTPAVRAMRVSPVAALRCE
jgi:predicted permease